MNKILLLIGFCASTIFAQTGNELQGTGSGVNISTGDYNTFYGDSSGYTISSGSMNVFNGYKAGFFNTTSENLFMGYEAGYNNTTGLDNTFIGFRSGYYNLSAGDNTFLGNASGFNNTTGTDNTFIGEAAGAGNSTGSDNTFIGHKAGSGFYSSITSSTIAGPISTASDNTAVGSMAMFSVTTGRRNTAIGNEAGYDLKDGHSNTFVGDSAGADVGAGIKNTFIGQGAGCATEHSSNNTFVGYKAGLDNNRTNTIDLYDAQRNTYLGTQTGATNRLGSDNVGLGAFADFSNTDFSRCTFIGAGGAGWDNTGWTDGFSMVRANDVTTMGYKSIGAAQYGIGIGTQVQQYGIQSINLGYNTKTTNTANYTTLIGANAYATKAYSIGIGQNDTINGQHAIAIGAFSAANADSSIAIGSYAKVNAKFSSAVGYGAEVNAENAVAIGYQTKTAQDQAMVLGDENHKYNVGIATSTPNTNASLTLADSTSGLLINRLTTDQKNTLKAALGNTDQGMMIYDIDSASLMLWNGTDFIAVTNENNDNDQQVIDAFNINSNILNLSISNDNQANKTVDLSPYLDNTDAQTLNLATATNQLSIANGNTVDLSAFMDNTDAQNITAQLVGSDLEISIDNGNQVTVDLSPLLTDLEARVQALEDCACNGSTNIAPNQPTNYDKAILYQNIPNPFNGTSSIKYYLPIDQNEAHLVFSNASGQLVETVVLNRTDNGYGEFLFNANSLASGTYYYTLYINQQRVDTKKMIIE